MAMTREEFAFNLKQKYPQYREVDNDELVTRVVAKYPQYRSEIVDLPVSDAGQVSTNTGFEITEGAQRKPSFDLERAPADLLRGAGAGIAKTATGLGELGTRLANALKAAMSKDSPVGLGDYSRSIGSAFSQDDASTAPFDRYREEIAEVTPDSAAAKVGEGGEQVAEFFVPGAAGVKARAGAGLLARMGAEALGAGAVGSAQEGNLDVGSAIGGAGGAVVSAGLGAASRGLGKRAQEIFSRIVRPRGEHSQGQVTAAIEDLVSRGEVPVGGLDSIAEQVGKQADVLGERVKAFRSGAAQAIPLDDVVKELQATRQALHGAESGQVLDPTMLAQVDDLLGQVENLATTPARRFIAGPTGGGGASQVGANPEAVEELLRAASNKIYAMTSDPAAGTVRAGLERGADAVRKGMNETMPGREAVTTPFANRRALSESLEAQVSGAPFKEPPQAGQILALSAVGAGIGNQFGGGEGAASGALIAGSIPLLGSRLLKSPLWRSLSAKAQSELAQLLTKMPKDEAGRLINSLLQVEVGGGDVAQP